MSLIPRGSASALGIAIFDAFTVSRWAKPTKMRKLIVTTALLFALSISAFSQSVGIEPTLKPCEVTQKGAYSINVNAASKSETVYRVQVMRLTKTDDPGKLRLHPGLHAQYEACTQTWCIVTTKTYTTRKEVSTELRRRVGQGYKDAFVVKEFLYHEDTRGSMQYEPPTNSHVVPPEQPVPEPVEPTVLNDSTAITIPTGNKQIRTNSPAIQVNYSIRQGQGNKKDDKLYIPDLGLIEIKN